ncbi:MAG: glycosyltransferase [Oscillospiraceae bacterium]|nr:glycosyltransferase [Oscillospiraceae bacterium]
MKLLCSNIEKIAENIKHYNKQIIIFGAGVIGSVIVPYYIEKYRLENNIKFFADNSLTKKGKKIKIGSEDIPVCLPSELNKVDGKNTVIIITASFYNSIISQLNDYSSLNEAEYFIFPEKLIEENIRRSEQLNIEHSNKIIIPKTIHYIWIGGTELPEHLQKCVDSWKKFCPDYDIVCWNESNYDFSKNDYMKQAYASKKWAFVSDYARLDILYKYGGIYLDTDVELLKSLDDMLYQTAYCSVEKWNVINTGGGCGSVKNSSGIKAMLDFRNRFNFINKDGTLNMTASGYYETVAMINNGFIPDGTYQKILDMNIYPYSFFHPYDYLTKQMNITENTLSIHRFNNGWTEKK